MVVQAADGPALLQYCKLDTMVAEPDNLPTLKVKSMLLSGSSEFFHADVSCMSASLCTLFFLHTFRQQPYLPNSLHSAERCLKLLTLHKCFLQAPLRAVSCFASAFVDVHVLLCLCIKAFVKVLACTKAMAVKLTAIPQLFLHCLALASSDISMCAAADLSSGSPTTEAGTASGTHPDTAGRGGDAAVGCGEQR